MKNKSLESILFLGVLIVMQTGCNPQNNTNDEKEKYNQAIAMQNRAKFLRHEGDIDSAITYYRKSLHVCYALAKTSDAAKDTVYNRKIAHLNNSIGYVYDSLHNFDSALIYLKESLKWAKICKMITMQIGDEELIGYIYYRYGKRKDKDSPERTTLFSNGIIYFRTGLRTSDSSGIQKNRFTLDMYLLLRIMYKENGDSVNKQYFDKQYDDLSSQLLSHQQ